jgi:hypothetical protein
MYVNPEGVCRIWMLKFHKKQKNKTNGPYGSFFFSFLKKYDIMTNN